MQIYRCEYLIFALQNSIHEAIYSLFFILDNMSYNGGGKAEKR